MNDKTKATDLPDAIDWIYKNAGKGEYAKVDKNQLAAAGQSCDGIQVCLSFVSTSAWCFLTQGLRRIRPA
jgi:hypothetical protein